MKENFCTFAGKRNEVLVAYVYGEMNGDERTTFERHASACVHCQAELDALGAVRDELGRWTPPEPLGHVDLGWALPVARPRGLAWIREVPMWAQAVAAVLVVGVAAGVANLEVRFASEGLTVSTGWHHPSGARVEPAEPLLVQSASGVGPASSTESPWRKELVALERDLRASLAARAGAGDGGGATDESLLRRVRTLIQESERRQQSELALRVAEVARDMQMQRQADLVKIDRSLGLIQSRTGMEVMRTQRQVNSLAQQVSQRP